MDFAGTIETWRRVLTQPGEPVFLEEKNRPQATLQTALIWMLIAGVVAAIFGFLQSLTGVSSVDAMLDQADLPPEVAAQMAPLLGAAVGGAGIAAIITVPVFFLIGSFIYHLLATMLGGQGDYGKALAVVLIPIALIFLLFLCLFAVLLGGLAMLSGN